MVPCKSAPEDVSFEWSHSRILSTDSKVLQGNALHVSIIDSGTERVTSLSNVLVTFIHSWVQSHLHTLNIDF